MMRDRIRLMAAAVLAPAMLFTAAGCGEKRPQEEKVAYKEVEVVRGTFESVITANGVIRPIDRVEIKSKASGEVVDLPVEQGDRVKRGDLIARLDQKDERASLEQARADLDIARAQLLEAQSAFDRRDQLFRERLISEEERDQIVLNLAVAKGRLVRATTSLERAEERFAEAVVRSPIDGIILQKYVEEGQIIASGVSNVGGGTPVVDVAEMTDVYIEAGIDEIDIGKIRVGQRASVTAEAFPEMRFEGTIVRIAPEAKIEQNVTLFDVVIEVKNRDLLLKSGMNTGIEISTVREENVLLVPAVALQATAGSSGAPGETGRGGDAGKANREGPRERTVLLKKGGAFQPHPISIGNANFKLAVVRSGLREGDVLGIPLVSRLKEENDAREKRIRSSRGFGTGSRSDSKRSEKKPGRP